VAKEKREDAKILKRGDLSPLDSDLLGGSRNGGFKRQN